MASFEAFTRQIEQAREFLDDIFPDAILIAPALLPKAEEERIHRAGFGIAEVVTDDGNVQHATYVIRRTKYVEAIEGIWQREQAGELPPGSHESAMDSIMHDEFDDEWGAYVPQSTEN